MYILHDLNLAFTFQKELSMPFITNWRNGQPEVAHMSAIRWQGIRPIDGKGQDGPDDRRRLTRLRGFARHALQGRKTSDHHKHARVEQAYYILSGSGEVLCGDARYPVVAGDAVYLPADIHHQMFNDMNDAWLEHLVIAQDVDDPGGDCVVSNWQQVPPVGDSAGAVRWRQLSATQDGGSLKGLAFIDREAVQPHNQTVARQETLEQVYYILENQGTFLSEDQEHPITEGDIIHVPPGMAYQIQNPNDTWLSYLIMAA